MDHLAALIAASYQHHLGRSLLPAEIPPEAHGHWLYAQAPFCLLAHNAAPDPCFIYANQSAQTCFEYSQAEFIALPSRLSAEAPNRAERQRLLDAVARHGYAEHYRGLRVTKSGRRFWIDHGIVWQLTDPTGALHGQAALFPTWHDA